MDPRAQTSAGESIGGDSTLSITFAHAVSGATASIAHWKDGSSAPGLCTSVIVLAITSQYRMKKRRTCTKVEQFCLWFERNFVIGRDRVKVGREVARRDEISRQRRRNQVRISREDHCNLIVPNFRQYVVGVDIGQRWQRNPDIPQMKIYKRSSEIRMIRIHPVPP